MNQLLTMAKQAAEIAHNTQELSDKLKDLVIDTSWQTNTSTIDPLVFAITIFVLASFVGYYVVWKVTPALHTPLMSITNAISGIIVLSSMIAASSSAFGFPGLLGYFATLLASINIFGGFIVTKRMLEMFKKK
ncbi:NAD(P) transhydrogenase subunit alpha [Rickettsia conorii subsp. heilongjiangensis]|uniref:proton-translocating NAD(P)(+) transhydrogenase n=1 Tax=Rickettsia conorii subsp. heilongjiangensis TaxID=226665 RepID=A0AAD1GJU7_RICCR|nr:proton-translocating transhydrogenase family protein [Rickettsia conorii]AEK75290.1 NAD(P) transhydrogenase subunit alpha [Rickettsia conorii subsp. heilongjiangensis 054]BBM92015.1 NAD(P) transhydrogenase subunit alpha [Rickettsia conorii subsp. heilongjiangensis]BBM93224.1 NAD(P) transhydrogenase subunit alpha [Rickettsia conorii subsp. heilongjiangensis]BBM94433.1 NAD(P) transhydrogenase subunit alpha [Rickettsia conorii subsp. heilongjiangensis]BBM95642.1 NAD(P) transhydrogenase subunit